MQKKISLLSLGMGISLLFTSNQTNTVSIKKTAKFLTLAALTLAVTAKNIIDLPYKFKHYSNVLDTYDQYDRLTATTNEASSFIITHYLYSITKKSWDDLIKKNEKDKKED